MRLFVAVNLPEGEKARLYDAAAPLREADFPVNWVEPEAIHLTLKFLGEVATDRVDRVVESLATVAAKSKPFDLELGGFGAFSSLRRPRVIWAGAYASPELRCLKHDLEWEFASLGYEREARSFHPHLTLGRARSDARVGDFRDLENVVAELDFSGALPVRSIELMRSKTKPSGAEYERARSIELGEVSDKVSVSSSS